MFRKLLRLGIERRTTRSDDLARDLNMSPKLLRLALEELVRRDYLRALVPSCSAGCGCCPLRAACLHRGRPRGWVLTSKGDKLLAKSIV